MPNQPKTSGRCENCKRDGIVGLNGRWLCLPCFEAAMEHTGGLVRQLRKAFETSPVSNETSEGR